MQINKKDLISLIQLLETLYNALNKKGASENEHAQVLSVVARSCQKMQPLYQGNPHFSKLNQYVDQLVLSVKTNRLDETKRMKLLTLLERFELSLLKDARFHLYLHNCQTDDVPLNMENMQTITKIPTPSLRNGGQDFTVLVHSSPVTEQDPGVADFSFQLDALHKMKTDFVTNLRTLDYHTYDRLFLDSKVNSLKKRQDVRILLAGSSYTMCGLYEEQMPLPARNIAVDSQDIYYSIKSIETALDHNPNITQVVFSFAYYLWGVDISLSSYLYKRVTDVNYPIFKDKHNFPGMIDSSSDSLINPITPLQKFLFPFAQWAEHKAEYTKNQFEDAHYFLSPRTLSSTLAHDDATNNQLAKQVVDVHNKFFKYGSTVKENQKLLRNFLRKMNERGVEVTLFVPPMTSYYRNNVDPKLISNFHTCMTPLQEQFQFQLIDLFDSSEFNDADFYDYDHLNDSGAKKLGNIIKKTLPM